MQQPDDVTLSASGEGVTLERDGRVWQFDAAGRLATVYDGDHVYHRGLDNAMLEKWWEDAELDGEPLRLRRSRQVPAPERDALVETAYETAERALRPLLDGGDRDGDHSSAESESVRRVLEYTPEELARERREFESIYRPVGMLPPDQYRAVVLQAVTGCPYSCSFCTLYDTDVAVQSLSEFEEHVAEVESFFGRGIRSRRSVFLGDANPLVAPEETLTGMLDVVARELPAQFEQGVHAFLNVRTAANTSVRKFEALADHGLERVYFGVESGASEVLDRLDKPQTPEEIVTGVERVKSAGLRTGVIVMAGVGGHELADAHLSETLDAVADLPLDSDDIVYVSPLDVGAAAQPEQFRGQMTGTEIAAQAERLKAALAERTPARASTYHVADFTYF